LYHQSLPLMLVGTMGLAIIADALVPRVKGGAIALFRWTDDRLRLPGLGAIEGSVVDRGITDRMKR
jgi:hypothetical protein